jgi:hypothetical protein
MVAGSAGVPERVQRNVPSVCVSPVPLKPAPGTDTDVPAAPESGERSIFGSTMNVAGVLSPKSGALFVCVPLGNVVMVSTYPAALHFEPAPTLNVADTVRVVVVVDPLRPHDGESITRPVGAVTAHVDPSPAAAFTEPEMVTSVPKSLETGGEPLTGLNVNATACTLGVTTAETEMKRTDDSNNSTRYELPTLLVVKSEHAVMNRHVLAI